MNGNAEIPSIKAAIAEIEKRNGVVKSTPGPWRVVSEKMWPMIRQVGSPHSIAAVQANFTPEVESANARLIAAAPRMREGLETIANVGSGEAKRIALEILRDIDAEAQP